MARDGGTRADHKLVLVRATVHGIDPEDKHRECVNDCVNDRVHDR